MNKSILFLALVAPTSFAHLQSPGLITDLRIFKEVNSYEFTLTNGSSKESDYNVYIGDFDPDTKSMLNDQLVGTIRGIERNEAVKFSVNLKIDPNQHRERLMCTELANENAVYKSRVCSKIVMSRR